MYDISGVQQLTNVVDQDLGAGIGLRDDVWGMRGLTLGTGSYCQPVSHSSFKLCDNLHTAGRENLLIAIYIFAFFFIPS